MIFLYSPARNPDGSLVRPTEFEVNDSISTKLALAALALVVVGSLLALLQYRARRRRSGLLLAVVSAAIILLHPRWTVSDRGGDGGELRVDASWIVLGVLGTFLGIQIELLIWTLKERDGPNRLDYDDRLPRQVPR